MIEHNQINNIMFMCLDIHDFIALHFIDFCKFFNLMSDDQSG